MTTKGNGLEKISIRRLLSVCSSPCVSVHPCTALHSSFANDNHARPGRAYLLIFLVCALMFRLHVHLCTTWVHGAQRGHKGIGSPGTGAVESCKLLCGCWELNSGRLEERPVFLTTEALSPVPPRLEYLTGIGNGSVSFSIIKP